MQEQSGRKPYPTDVTAEEWAFVAPYLALIRKDAAQRTHELREVFNALRWIVRAGAPWRMLPTNFPPWEAVYQQTPRWLAADVFEQIVQDLRVLLRLDVGRAAEARAGRHGCERGAGPGGPGLDGRGARRGGPEAWNPTRGRQVAGGEARLRASAPQVGGLATLRLDGVLPPPGSRLRAASRPVGRASLRRLRLSHARSALCRCGSIARSRGNPSTEPGQVQSCPDYASFTDLC